MTLDEDTTDRVKALALKLLVQSHLERCFLYGCERPLDQETCPYCGKWLGVKPKQGIPAGIMGNP